MDAIMNYLQRFKQKIFHNNPFPGIRPLARMNSTSSPASQGERIYKEYGLHFDDLRKAAGLEWSDIKDNPAALEDFAYDLRTKRLIERGEVPPDYKYIALCRSCGPVWLWFKGKLEGCPWCENRLQGKPVPYPGEKYYCIIKC
jgi:hypothetical protein